MNSRENLLTTLRRKVPDRVPIDLDWCGFNREAFRLFREKTGSDNPHSYFGADKNFEYVGLRPTMVNLKERYSSFYQNLSPSATISEWGIASVPGSNPAFDLMFHPLEKAGTLKEIEDYPIPDWEEAYRYEGLDKQINNVKKNGFAAASETVRFFELPCWMRGHSELFTDFLVREDMAACLLDRITSLNSFLAKRYAEMGVDIIFVGDDAGMEDRMMISPDTWRKWIKPRFGRVIKEAKEISPDVLIWFHSDGYIEPIIPDLIEVGVDILNPVQPECMDPAKIKKSYGDKLAFWGTIGIQTTLPFGTPEEVRDVVKERIETVGEGGGLVIGPTHAIEPEVPLENLTAFVEAAREYGKY